jgi:hypothetical protein
MGSPVAEMVLAVAGYNDTAKKRFEVSGVEQGKL